MAWSRVSLLPGFRYRKGQEVDFIWRYEWWKMHEEIMIVASEAVLPLGIT